MSQQQSNHLKAIKLCVNIQGYNKRSGSSLPPVSSQQLPTTCWFCWYFFSLSISPSCCLVAHCYRHFPSMNNAPGITNIFWWNCYKNRRQYFHQSSQQTIAYLRLFIISPPCWLALIVDFSVDGVGDDSLPQCISCALHVRLWLVMFVYIHVVDSPTVARAPDLCRIEWNEQQPWLQLMGEILKPRC